MKKHRVLHVIEAEGAFHDLSPFHRRGGKASKLKGLGGGRLIS